MKYVNCPTCEWTLGVPGKLLGHPVTCPKCDNNFLAQEEQATQEKPAKKKRKKKEVQVPSVRALPTPLVPQTQESSSHSSTSDFEPPTKEPHEAEPPARPRKNKNRLRSPHRDTPQDAAAENESKSKNRLKPKSTANSDQQKVTARIIHAEPEEQDIAKDGTLPTLQLKDDVNKNVDRGELKSRPVFLGLVICASVLASGLMLFLADLSPKADEAVLNRARNEIGRFYSVRSDVQLKPFQLELREAQLAHSKKDRKGEIAAYRKVMSRFRAEDKSKNGVTGSPSADNELKKLVSILLGDGKSGSIP